MIIHKHIFEHQTYRLTTDISVVENRSEHMTVFEFGTLLENAIKI